jgi:hypothetical protein
MHAAPHAVAPEGHHHLVETAQVGGIGAQHLDLPAVPGGEGPVHLEQVAGEQVGLLAALGPPDLDDHVALVVGVAGQQQHPQLVGEAGDVGLGLVDLGLQQAPFVGAGIVLHPPGGLQVLPPLPQLTGPADDRLELAVAPRHLLVAGLVGDQAGVGQARLDVVELLVQLSEAFEHDVRGYPADRPDRPPAASTNPSSDGPSGARSRAGTT